MLYIVGVGTPIAFQESIIFSDAVCCGCDYTQGFSRLIKKYRCGHTHNYIEKYRRGHTHNYIGEKYRCWAYP